MKATISENCFGDLHVFKGHININTYNPANHLRKNGDESDLYFQSSSDKEGLVECLSIRAKNKLISNRYVQTKIDDLYFENIL